MFNKLIKKQKNPYKRDDTINVINLIITLVLFVSVCVCIILCISDLIQIN